MVEAVDVRRIALAGADAADTSEGERLAFEFRGKGFAWSYLARVEPKKPRTLRADVLAVRCDIARKEMLIAAAPEIYFDDDHYRGYPAVLIRLAAIDEAELAVLMDGAREMAARKPKRKLRAART
jgi:hypothetical protein